jgi:hypothetical protein
MLKTTQKHKVTLLLLRRHHQSLVLSIENNVLSSEHDITVDLKVGSTVTLYTAEASVGIDLSKGDGVAGNHGGVRWAHCNTKIWELGVAGVGESAYLGVVGRTLDLCVVGVRDLGVDEEEGSTGVYQVKLITGLGLE